ncbi:MAG: Flp pilus assembly complex ATPase component TadA [Phycisphaerales bacterium]|nr:Flp pilus assembly complex ATPase component TadA [Phycisphaerales bacterium]
MPLTLAQDAYILVSPWKPVLLLIPLVAWARLISANYDKHAARFHLEPKKWNAFHLFVGLIAFGVAAAMPLKGPAGVWVALAAELGILGISVFAYPLIANKDERVPDTHHVKFFDLSAAAEKKKEKAAAKLAGTAELAIKAEDGALAVVPDREAPEYAVRVAAEGVLLRGKAARASEMVVRPTGKDQTYGVVFSIDGVPTADTTLPATEAIQVIDFWKAAAKLDVGDRRRKQTANLDVNHQDKRHKVKLTTAGGQAGMILTLLLDPANQVRRKFSDMGLLEPQTEAIKQIVADAAGVVIVGTPPDSGGTTLLYTMVKMHDAYTQNVQTVEIDPQDVLEGVRQNRFDPNKEGQEFSTLTRSILRRDPDVVGIADLPDSATAKEICRADQDRTRQYVLLRAGGALQAIQAWCKTVGELPMAAAPLHGVISARLVRCLCQNCRVSYTPSADMLKKLGLPSDKVPQLFKKGGQVLIKNKPETCPVCNGIGYIGQTGVFEAYPLGPAERELIKSGNLAALRSEFRKRGAPTIQQAALLKAVEGVTSIEEIMRITAAAETPKAPQPTPTA